MSQFTNILLAPYHFFFGENGIFSSSMLQRGNEANQALYFGIPALLFAIFGVLFLIVGELSAGKTLIKKYEDEVALISKQESKLKKELSQELRMAQASNKKLEVDTTEIARLRDELAALLESKKILLSKLHSLAPEQGKYQFQLANTFFTKALSQREQVARLRLANTHLDHALVRNENNTSALSMKVLICQRFGQFDEAKIYLKRLFEAEPYVYPQLSQLNIRIGADDENLQVLHSARERLSGQLQQMTGSSDRRTKCATYLVDCFHRLEDIDGADKVIDDEIRNFPDAPSIEQWGKRLKGIGYELRYRLAGDITTENASELFGYLRSGYELDRTNQKILEHIINLRSSKIPGLAELSEEIYQPSERAPASVENIIGTQALAKKNYLKASKHITRATQKDPNNGDFLNNLAYLYLIRPEPDPEEALKLIDRAILNAQTAKTPPERLTHFYDTKGRALLALGKLAEENGEVDVAASQYAAAVAQLLKALIQRPDDLSISKAVVECYQANGQTEMAEVWTERVRNLQAAQDN